MLQIHSNTCTYAKIKINLTWPEFWNLLPLLTSRGLPLGGKGRLYSAFVRSVCCMAVSEFDFSS